MPAVTYHSFFTSFLICAGKGSTVGRTRRRSHCKSWESTEETSDVVFGMMIQRITLLIVSGVMEEDLREERKVGMSVLRERRRRAIGAILQYVVDTRRRHK